MKQKRKKKPRENLEWMQKQEHTPLNTLSVIARILAIISAIITAHLKEATSVFIQPLVRLTTCFGMVRSLSLPGSTSSIQVVLWT